MELRTLALVPTLALAAGLALGGCAAAGAARPAPTAPTSAAVAPPSEPSAPASGPALAASASAAAEASAAPPNGQDLLFAKMMVSHHAQAVRMSELLLGKDGVPERVAAIAAYIHKDQAREITEMNAWLVAWGQPAVSPDDPKMARQHGSGHGMLTEAQLAALAAADGPAATPLYLEQMIEHHTGAILMARSVLRVGHNAYIRNLAKHIINEQGSENEAMTKLLKP